MMKVGGLAKIAPFTRAFSTSRAVFAKDKALETQRKKKRFQTLKKKHTGQPQNHPLYMDIPTALRYLRASAVGQPSQMATICIQMVVVPEKSSLPISGLLFLPNSLKEMRILAITSNPETQQKCLEAGAANAGGSELLEALVEGKIEAEYDRAFATPEMVSTLGKYARFLGPRGLMPSVKKDTVRENILLLIQENKGSLPFKQKGFNLSLPVGRCDFTDKQILENLKAASDTIFNFKAKLGKSNVLGSTVLTCNLGPSIAIDFRP